jgi:hypothetical protein
MNLFPFPSHRSHGRIGSRQVHLPIVNETLTATHAIAQKARKKVVVSAIKPARNGSRLIPR